MSKSIPDRIEGDDYTCVFNVQIKCAESRLLHLNADYMCSKIHGPSVPPRDAALHADADLHADPVCVLAAVHNSESA
jgi:hypothetical protein